MSSAVPLHARAHDGDPHPAHDGGHDGPCHRVQFYERDGVLADTVAGFLAAGLQAGLPVLVIATPGHRALFAAMLMAQGYDAEGAQTRGQLTWLDARTLLGTFMVGPLPDATRFRAQLSPVLERVLRASGRERVCAYGEMVDLLWRDGNTEGALRLEELWNELARTYAFSLLCAYSMGGRYAEQHGGFISEVRRLHDDEGHGGPEASPRERAAELEQRTVALEAEVAHRRTLEARLRVALRERQLAEKRLWERERQLAEAQRVAGLGSWTCDEGTQDAEWSDELWRILGLEPGALRPSVASLVATAHPEDRARLREALARSRPEALEVRFVRPGGNERVCEVRVQRAGPVTGRLSGTLLDVTEQRAAERAGRALEARLHESQRLESLGLLAGGIAHDFNNLLVSVLGNAEVLYRELPGGCEHRALAGDIVLAAQRSADLTRKLLAYAGRGQFQLTPVDLGALALELSALLHTAMPAGADFRIDVAEALPPVRGDRTQLMQVLMNLVTNAADALGPDGGHVRVCLGAEWLDAPRIAELEAGGAAPRGTLAAGGFLCLAVSDTGVGMAPEVQARMFEPFFTTKASGHGLGLSATRGIVHAHGGALRVDSAPGRGTTFQVWLPTSVQAAPGERADAGEQAQVPEAPEAARRTVLVVDDEPGVRRMLVRVLERMGHRVLAASEGREALALLDHTAHEVDLLMLDLTMPQLGGLAMLDTLAGRHPGLPVLLMSGYTETPHDVRKPEHGGAVVGFLSKPFDLAELTRVVTDALAVQA